MCGAGRRRCAPHRGPCGPHTPTRRAHGRGARSEDAPLRTSTATYHEPGPVRPRHARTRTCAARAHNARTSADTGPLCAAQRVGARRAASTAFETARSATSLGAASSESIKSITASSGICSRACTTENSFGTVDCQVLPPETGRTRPAEGQVRPDEDRTRGERANTRVVVGIEARGREVSSPELALPPMQRRPVKQKQRKGSVGRAPTCVEDGDVDLETSSCSRHGGDGGRLPRPTVSCGEFDGPRRG